MLKMKTANSIIKEFKQWNGWGPPTSEYQIYEFCSHCTESESESDYAFEVLSAWMAGKLPS